MRGPPKQLSNSSLELMVLSTVIASILAITFWIIVTFCAVAQLSCCIAPHTPMLDIIPLIGSCPRMVAPVASMCRDGCFLMGLLQVGSFCGTPSAWPTCTMRFASTAKVLANVSPKYYGISSRSACLPCKAARVSQPPCNFLMFAYFASI